MNTPTSETSVTKHFGSNILLWMRQDRPRQAGMDHWKGPHSGIISATPGLLEYRQVHLAQANPGRWPATPGLKTAIPDDRRVDGIAEVTFTSPLAPLMGRTQTQLAYADEINVFRRTLLYAGAPGSSRWYAVGEDGAPVGARAVLYLPRKAGVGARDFSRFVTKELAPALAAGGTLTELRTHTFLPWSEKMWDTPHVAHDNPKDQRFHAFVTLGFADEVARDRFFGDAAGDLSSMMASRAGAVHAYDVETTLTFVEHEQILDTPHT